MKHLIYVALFVAFASCGNVRTLEGKAKPVYFSADTSLFSDSLYPVHPVYYFILGGLQGDFVQETELRQGKTAKAFIHSPTFFHFQGNRNAVLLYPGERILLRGSDYDFTFSSVKGDLRRDRELLFFKTFHQLEKRPPEIPRTLDYTLQTLLDIEKEQKTAIPKAEAASQAIFDSLLNAYDVSKKFIRLTKNYVQHRYESNLRWLYNLYKDTLAAHGLYFEQYRQLIPPINSITEKEQLNANVQTALIEINRQLFPNNLMWSMNDEHMFKACFDSVESNFKGLARDYLLSRAMYRAYTKLLKVPEEYEKKYKQYSINKDYRKIVSNAKKRPQRQQQRAVVKSGENMLLAPDGKTELGMEQMLAQHSGKYVLIDLWASWCLPCMEQMPYLKKLKESYPQDKIVFITISLDKSISSWLDAMHKRNMQKENSYLLLNAQETSFYRHYKINEIPRYLLFDREGQIMDDKAPAPSEPALNNLLDKVIF